MDESYDRSSSDVREIIKHAKLHESELTDLTQVLRFPEEDPAFENLKFLQVDQHLLEELTKGGTIVFKGSQSDNAVLCTSSRTYDIKEAETSNSLLLIPGLLWGKQTKLNDPGDESMNDESMEDKHNKSSDVAQKNISPDTSLNNSTDSDKANRSPRKLVHKDILKVFYTYYEPRLCKPHLGKLNDLLQCTRYSGPEYEYSIDKKLLLTHQQLRDIIQASDQELSEGLDNLQAMEVDGYFRILAFEYEFRVVSYMLDLIDENSWDPDKISKKVTLETLKDLVPAVILDNMFDFYTEKGSKDGLEQLFKYKEGKVCRFLAQVLLKSAGKFNLNDFMLAWKDSVPEGMVAEESMLDGMALIDLDSNPQVIWAFYENTLPQNISERFRILFQTKPKWTVAQIAPYIERFTTEKLNVNALLTKYARGSNHNNVRYYSAKHGK